MVIWCVLCCIIQCKPNSLFLFLISENIVSGFFVRIEKTAKCHFIQREKERKRERERVKKEKETVCNMLLRKKCNYGKIHSLFLQVDRHPLFLRTNLQEYITFFLYRDSQTLCSVLSGRTQSCYAQ